MTKKQVGDGLLSGKQRSDYFNFVCGYCGAPIHRIMVHDVDAVGFRLGAKCQACRKEVTGLKVNATWGKAMVPHVRARFEEIATQLKKL